MKKIFSIQIVTLLIFSGGLGGMLFFTDVYDEVYSGIVSVLCLSCLKLEPKTKTYFAIWPNRAQLSTNSLSLESGFS